MKSIIALLLGFVLSQLALAQSIGGVKQDARGFIDVYALRTAAASLTLLEPKVDVDRCESQSCEKAYAREKLHYDQAHAIFMSTWGRAMLEAISKGDEVAEVIWLQCKMIPAIERSAMASTCDKDPARRLIATKRLNEIGFEAALNEKLDGGVAPRSVDLKRNLSQTLTGFLSRMQAGEFGESCDFGDFGISSISSYNQGIYMAMNPQELSVLRLALALRAATTLTRRAFTMSLCANGQLGFNLVPIGVKTLAWGDTVFSTHTHPVPYPSKYDANWDGYKVWLNYDKKHIQVAGKDDAVFLRLLNETLLRSEQRIDYWLKRDPRWAVFLLHRHGHHEWVPAGIESPLGRLDQNWHGQWVLEHSYADFLPQKKLPFLMASIYPQGSQTVIQIEENNLPKHRCELRYSGATSIRVNRGSEAESYKITALGYLSGFSNFNPEKSGHLEPLAPMSVSKAYRQVLVQCEYAEWPSNNNVHFLFLVDDTLIEVIGRQDSKQLTIRHWSRVKPSVQSVVSKKALPIYDPKPALSKLAHMAANAESGKIRDDQALTKLKIAQDKVRALLPNANVDQLIESLAVLRNEQLFYERKNDFPDNLNKLIKTPGVATKVCDAYRANPPDPVTRFNYVLVFVYQLKERVASPIDKPLIADCLRLALTDTHGWVRTEASSIFPAVAEERDRALLKTLEKDTVESVQRYTHGSIQMLDKKLEVK
jgi:hypothetical protein